MRTGSAPKHYYQIAIRLGIFFVLAAILAVPLYTSSTAASHEGAGKTATAVAATDSSGALSPVFNSRIGRTVSFPLMLPQATPTPAIATYDPTCVTPDSDFNLGQDVCATATTTGGSAARRRITWSDPDGNVRQTTPVTTDPQSDHFTIPGTPTSTLANGQVVNNVGKWRVSLVGRSLVTFAEFLVKDPNNASADLSITKNAPANSQSVAAGSNGSFDIFVINSGPDDAATVSVVDHVPTNTTFVTMVQTSGQPTSNFTCTTAPDGSGDITCNIATLTAGASATFSFVYTVNTGTPAGTSITNTASIQSATNDRNSGDNSATASATVAGGTGGGTCTLTCPANISTAADTTENGQPGAIVHFDSPSAQGATCGTVTVDHCNDCFFPVGTTTVNASEDGATGASCSFTVTVSEGGAPTITCPPDKTATANSDCEATVDPGSPTTTGDSVTVTGSRSDGRPLSDPYPAGTTTITWTATNSSGTASCQQAIVVNDITAPTISCPANRTASNDAGQCSATVDPGTATAADNCGAPTVTGQRSDGQSLDAPYPTGTTTITWTATDDAGNSSSCTQTVTVNDTENPTVSCPANISANTDPGTCSATVDPGTATAADNCPGSTVAGTRSDGQALNAPYPKGTTAITWTATDAAGNHSSSCTQTVTVADHENPSLTCPANMTVNEEPGTCAAHVNPGTPTASDNCGSATVSGSRSDGKPLSDPYPLGTTTITWTATDSSGNQSSCTQTITVVDNVPPTITFDSFTIFLNNATIVFTTNSVTINGTTYPFNGTSCSHDGYSISFNGSTLTITYNNHSYSYTFSGKTLVLWTPTHQYQTVKVADLIASASDDCDSSVNRDDVRITQVTSDEPDDIAGGGDGNTVNDMVIAADCKSVQVRAERNGSGNGRVYTITFKVRDASNNTTTVTSKLKIFANSVNVVDDGPHNTVNGTCPLP